MAAVSTFPARSTLQRGPNLENLPATVTQQNPSEFARLAKRKHDTLEDHDAFETSKKQRLQYRLPNSQPKFTSRTLPARDAAVSHKPAVKDSVTHIDYKQNQNAVQQTAEYSARPIIAENVSVTQSNAAPSGSTRAVKQDEKRTLRSQGGGSRYKSELAQYFANYDDIVSNEPQEPGSSPVAAL